jgi:CubicO group peptidase (beta-lactamase class C family)
VRPPGSGWAYSGAGYGLLQLIAENVSKKPFASFMQDAVFKPLWMTRSFFGNPELTDTPIVQHLDEAGRPIRRLGYANLAGAALYTTLNDFMKLVNADLAGAPGVLRPGDIALMESPAPGSQGKYGLGYFVERLTATEKVVGHDGSDVGWNSMYRMAPSRKAAFVMFTNNSMGLGAYFPAMCGWYRSLASGRVDYCPATAQLVVQTLYAQGEDAAVKLNGRLATQYGADYGFSRPYWNYVAYEILKRGSKAEAVALFRLITALNPTSADAFDSLAEGYMALNDRESAIAGYRKALELDPTLESSKSGLRALGANHVP